MKCSNLPILEKRWIGAAVVLLCSIGAHAETNPYFLGVSQRFTHNSNIFNRPDDTAVGSTVSSTGLRLGFDQPISRQRINASFSANANRYSGQSQLNNVDYALDARLDWETVERLSGNVTFGSRESLPTDTAVLAAGTKNLLHVDNVGIQAVLGGVTMWSFDAGAAYARSRYSLSTYAQNNDTNQQSVNAGVRVTPASGLTLRTGLRHANVDYQSGAKVSRNDLDFSATVSPTGASVLTSRVSLTRQQQTQAASALDRNVNSWTGAVGWNWQPTGKLSTGVQFSRDTGNGNYDFTKGAIVVSTDNYMTDTLQLSANWAATSKISVNANVSYARRNLDNAFLSNTPVTATDTTTTLGLNIQYALSRNIDLGCGVSWSDRSVSQSVATPVLTTQFNANTFTCYGQALLR